MSDKTELKTRSFRISDKTADRIREISSEIDGNQEEVLARLIQAFEFQSSKALLGDKRNDIEDFERLSGVLVRKYMSCIEDNQYLSLTIREDYEAMLNSKDKVIEDIQGQLIVATQLKEEAAMKARTLKEEVGRLNSENFKINEDLSSRIQDLQEALNAKDDLNKALTDALNELKNKVGGLERECEILPSLQKDLVDIKAERDRLAQVEADLKQKLEQALAAREKMEDDNKQLLINALKNQEDKFQMDCNKQLFDLKISYQEKIQEIKEQAQNEIDRYQQKYAALLERLESKTNQD